MRDIVIIGIKLTVITLLAAILLAVTNSVTQSTIDEQTALAEKEAKLAVLSSAESFSEVDVDDSFKQGNGAARIIEVYEGKASDEVVGYTIKVASGGYGGDINFVVGITTNGVIEAVKILSHSETPGLGAKASEDVFINQYQEKGEEPLVVSKVSTEQTNAIQAITGATITSQGVTNGVNYALECYQSIAGK